jgi:hypothetical protein
MIPFGLLGASQVTFIAVALTGDRISVWTSEGATK